MSPLSTMYWFHTCKINKCYWWFFYSIHNTGVLYLFQWIMETTTVQAPQNTNLCNSPIFAHFYKCFILLTMSLTGSVITVKMAVSRLLRGAHVYERCYCLHAVWRHLIISSSPHRQHSDLWVSPAKHFQENHSNKTFHNWGHQKTQTCTELNTRGRWKAPFNNREHNGQNVWQQRQSEGDGEREYN